MTFSASLEASTGRCIPLHVPQDEPPTLYTTSRHSRCSPGFSPHPPRRAGATRGKNATQTITRHEFACSIAQALREFGYVVISEEQVLRALEGLERGQGSVNIAGERGRIAIRFYGDDSKPLRLQSPVDWLLMPLTLDAKQAWPRQHEAWAAQ